VDFLSVVTPWKKPIAQKRNGAEFINGIVNFLAVLLQINCNNCSSVVGPALVINHLLMPAA
jgi:hypothetical protein